MPYVYAYCTRDQETYIDLVTGAENKSSAYEAYDERYGKGTCGEEGKYWEPKEEKDADSI
jgi:hypothetical protein